MARPVTVTKEKILAAALQIVREGGTAALTARSLSTALGSGVNPIFSAYGSMEGVLDAVKLEARKLYENYVNIGLEMNPPFKGYGLEFLWFAMDEPQLFKLLMLREQEVSSPQEFVKGFGDPDKVLEAIQKTFGLKGEDAETLYYHMMFLAVGLASIISTGDCRLTIGQASEIFGKACRAYLLEIKAGADARERYVPTAEGHGPSGKVSSYVDKGIQNIQHQAHMMMINTMVSQNYLLSALHASPRYIQDAEWKQLERLMQQSYETSAESFRKAYPTLTRSDNRLLILARFRFSVSDQGILLGISPTSVTKARQRLKAKLGTDNIEDFIENL